MPARAIYINMKSHFFQLLLLILLLVDTTHSDPPSVLGGLTKAIFSDPDRNGAKSPPPNALEKAVDNGKSQFSPSLPPAYNTEIQGLSEVKKYFYNFGYLQKTGHEFNDSLDNDTVSAITSYQQNFKLQITGDLSNETFQQIILPRCAVPDKNLVYGFSFPDRNVSWPKGNGWFPKGTKNLTYGFAPASEIPANMTEVFRDAFTRWSQATGVMNFTNTTYDDANIKIGFYNFSNFDEIVQDIVVAESFIRLNQSDEDSNVNITTGEMHLDASNYWVLPSDNFDWSWDYGEMDLETVAMHQIGHLLGLDHSFENDSVMYPIMPTQQREVLITDSDNRTIQKLYADSDYAAAAGCFVLFGSGSGLLTILSLGFAFMTLFD